MAIHMEGKEVQFKGAVLMDREENWYDDSDFYAVVWDAEKRALRRVDYATTRYYTYGNSCHVDATPEVKALAREWLEEWAFNAMKTRYEREASRVQKGRRVRVVKGRNVEHGTEGELFWLQETRHYTRIGIALTTERDDRGFHKDVVWTYASNVEVADPEVPSDDEIREEAREWASKGIWNAPFTKCGVIF